MVELNTRIRPEVCWSPTWGLLIKWPNDWSMWITADDGRDFGEVPPEDAVPLVPEREA